MNSTKIIVGAYCFICDDAGGGGTLNVVIRSNLIVELSKDLDSVQRKYPDAEIVDATGKLLLPTLFNAHFHPEAIVSRSLEPKIAISRWRTESLLKIEAVLDSQTESFYEKMYHLAFFSGLRYGVSGFAFSLMGDEAGVRGMYSAAKLAGVDVVAFAESDMQIAFLRRVVDSQVKSGLSVPYQKNLTLFGLSAVARNNADSPGWIMSHADEDDEDVAFTRSSFNSNMVHLLRKSRLLNGATVLVGLDMTSVNSINLARSADAKIVLIPTRLDADSFGSIRSAFDRFSIGSDWETPGLFDQMKRLVEFGCEPREALFSATRSGAELFNFGSRLGSVEVGKVANLVFLDGGKISARSIEKLSPPEAAAVLIEDYTDSDVCDVMLNGEFAYRDRKLLLYDSGELMKEKAELVEILMKSEKGTRAVSEVKTFSPKIPETRDGGPSELEWKSKSAELPKDVRKVFGEDEF